MSADILNYGGNNIAALQVTTGLYPSTAVPLDIRERVKYASTLTSNAAVGCKLYTGLRIYVEDTQETVTVLGLVEGADGSKWNHWKFDRIIQQFKDAIDDCRNVSHQGRYDLVEPGVYTPQNLLNYLFLRCNDTIVVTHLLTINYEFSDGTMASPTYVAQIPEGGAYNVSSPILSGYACSNEVISGTMGNTDVTVTVTYSAISYTLTYKKLETESEIYAEYQIPYGSVVTVPTQPTREHYTFKNWSYNPVLMSGNKMPASNVLALAVWQYIASQYNVSVTVAPTGAGTITGAGTYTEGSNVTLTATPASNYQFINWTENGQTLGTSTTLEIENLSSDRNITANFSAVQVTVSVGATTTPSEETGGTVAGGGQMPVGTSTTVIATVNPGYKFQGWYVGGTRVSTSTSYTFTANTNISLTARFIKIVTITATVSPNNYGTTSGQGEYEYGTTVTLTASPSTGKQFVKWVEESVEYTDNPLSFTATSDVTIRAEFEDIPQVKVYAWTSNSALSQSDLANVDLSTINSFATVYETQTDESYYVDVPQSPSHSQEDPAASTWLIAAIPDTFTHGTPAGSSGSFFRAPSTSDTIAVMPDLRSEKVTYNGIDYLVVESRELDTSSTGSDYPVLFGNVQGNSWIAAVQAAHAINLS